MLELEARDIYRSGLAHQRILLEMLETVAEDCFGYEDKVCRTHAIDGSIKLWDAIFLRLLLRHFKPASLLEVGSFLGVSTRWLLENSREWNAKVTAVDPNLRHRIFDSPQAVLERLNAKYVPDRLEIVTAFFGRPASPRYSDYEKYLPHRSRAFVDDLIKSRPIINGNFGKKFDFIFIDGDHSYEATMENFSTGIQMLNPRGIIAFHDVYSWPGVEQAMQTIIEQYSKIGEIFLWGKDMRHRAESRQFDGIFHFRLKTGLTGSSGLYEHRGLRI